VIAEIGRRHGAIILSVAALLLLVPGVSARQAFDRTKVPPAGPTPALHVPTWTRSTLSNGAELIVSERPGLPIV